MQADRVKNSLRHELMGDFGERVLFAMKLRGHNQTTLSHAVGLTQPEISNYCRGKNFPRLEVVQKLSLELLVSYTWLKIGKGDYKCDAQEIIASFQGSFPERLIWLLWTNNTNAKEVAKNLSLGGSTTITYWCEGQRFPRLPNIRMLSKYFRVSYSWLKPAEHERILDYREAKKLGIGKTEYFIIRTSGLDIPSKS